MKKVRCKKEFGTWFYDVEKANLYNDLDGPLYHLYDEHGEWENDFGTYGDMIYYIEYGIII